MSIEYKNNILKLNYQKDHLFEESSSDKRFTFDEPVARVFDDMAQRSIPMYTEVIHNLLVWADTYYQKDTTFYDIGCSTGTVLELMARNLVHVQDFVGVDFSPPMIEKASEKLAKFSNIELFCQDALSVELKPTSFVILNYVLQFLPKDKKKDLIDHISKAVVSQGCLFISEKICFHDKIIQNTTTDIYHQYKYKNDYSFKEIETKKKALKNYLIPLSLLELQELLKECGFSKVHTIMQWNQFVTLVAVKDPVSNARRSSQSQKQEKKLNLGKAEQLPNTINFETDHLIFSEDILTFGLEAELSAEKKEKLNELIKNHMPWKKGPFNLFGHFIDSEWQCNFKWNRIKPHLPSLYDKVIADIGCNNGWYMFKMLEHNPKQVIGFEPSKKNHKAFDFLQTIVRSDKLLFLPQGVETIDEFPEYFDVIFCLGILYHQMDPLGCLKKIYDSLKFKGTIFVDCQGVDYDDPVALMPSQRYAGAKGNWFLPSKSCLINWLKRSGFSDIEVFYEAPLSVDEQRKSSHAPIESLKEFLSEDGSKTIEGYPLPWRFYLKATKI